MIDGTHKANDDKRSFNKNKHLHTRICTYSVLCYLIAFMDDMMIFAAVKLHLEMVLPEGKNKYVFLLTYLFV